MVKNKGIGQQIWDDGQAIFDKIGVWDPWDC